jgi:hypothetical protein
MENEFCTYTQSLALKELGFDEPCFGYYENGVFIFWYDSKHDNEFLLNCSAPLKQQAFRWFRDEYGYCSYLKEATKGTYRFYIDKFDEKFFNSDIFKTYEESEFLCIDKLIEIVKNK